MKNIPTTCYLIFFASIILIVTSFIIPSDSRYTIDISNNNIKIISGHLQLGSNKNPKGEVLDANSLYFIRNGKPWFPVMGEFHFSRYPRAQWEESILKMKAAGIDVISTYIFWIYHEEVEGIWDWKGNNDLHYFASLCAKNHVYLFVRIGPWCHGEVRNGGFPDWLLNKNLKPRKNDSTYFGYVEKYFGQINQQLQGFYFKEGGSIIGTQIENEYRFNNPAGLSHMLTLKRLARDAGIDVPYYTATGWPGSDLKQNELIPVWGAYPEAPWDKRTDKLKPSDNYLFGKLRRDPAIGSDLLGNQKDTSNYSGYRYPYATAEMGGGNEITYHRRPIIEPDDVTALAYVKTGSGANLMGYYMFHGGSNAIGKLSTLQESKATKYPNDYPIISYDFYSPIGEWGQLQPSYRGFKIFHLFLNDFGDRLVKCKPGFPAKMPANAMDSNTLRWSVRSNNNSGFIFISNFQRQVAMKDIADVQFNIKTKDGILTIPQQPITIKKNAQMILPFNFDMEHVTLKYATAQLLCKLSGGKEPVYVFFAPQGIAPEYVFNKKGIHSLQSQDKNIITTDTTYAVRIMHPGMEADIDIRKANGKTIKILTLSSQQALDAWKATILGSDRLFISADDLVFQDGTIRVQSVGHTIKNGEVEMGFSVYPDISHLNPVRNTKARKTPEGIFTHYAFSEQAKTISSTLAEYKVSPVISPQNNNRDTGSTFTSMPLYGASIKAIPGARYWKVVIPENALVGLSDAFLKINYTGDTFATYLDGKLIADDFYAGLPMTISLNRFGSSIYGKELIMLVTPLSDSSKIYFEDDIRSHLKRNNVAEINKIGVVPQYQVSVIYN